MNRKKIIGIIAIILLVIMLIFTIILAVDSKNKKDQQSVKDADLINNNYSMLKNQVDIFNENRINIYNNILNNFYYEEVENNYDNWIDMLKAYEEIGINLKSIVDNLDSNCHLPYSDDNINKECKNYKKIYESIVNTLIKDIEIFNSQLNNYNQWVEKEASSYSKMNNYTSNFKDYIDYDKDKIFSGK